MGPVDRHRGTPAPHIAATAPPSTMDASTPAPDRWKRDMKNMLARVQARTATMRRRPLRQTCVAEQTRAPAPPRAAPNTSCRGADAMSHALLAEAEGTARVMQTV